MKLKLQIARNLVRVSRRLNNAAKRIIPSMFPGTITVDGKDVTDLAPLGGYHTPGITKAKRLSFSGRCEGRKVKLYSVYSAAQADLRVAFQKTDYGHRYFPEIVAHDQTHIVEEWIDGVPFKKLNKALQARGSAEIKCFLSQCGQSEELIQLAAAHRGAFCYFRDYLVKRLEPWQSLDFVREFVLSWQNLYEKIKDQIPLCLSHPDLSADNILLDKCSAGFVVVDNELLGVGRGWVLDGKNSLLNEFGRMELIHPVKKDMKDFLNLSWRLRWLGTSLDAGDFKQGYSIAVEPDFEI